MNFDKLGLFLYYHVVNIPNYLLNGIVLGIQKLEENKVASELERKRAVAKKTTQNVINIAQFISNL